MKLLNRTTSTVTTDTFEILFDGFRYTYIEYLNDKGKVIDVNFRDENGNEIDDTVLLEDVQKFVDSLDKKK